MSKYLVATNVMVNIKLLQDPHEELGVRPLDPSMFLINVYCVLKNVLEIQAEVRDSMIAAPKTPIRDLEVVSVGDIHTVSALFQTFQKSKKSEDDKTKLQVAVAKFMKVAHNSTICGNHARDTSVELLKVCLFKLKFRSHFNLLCPKF